MNKLGYTLLTISILMLDSCYFGAGVVEEHLTDDFSLFANSDLHELSILYESSTIIRETVFSVGYNEDFIIAKRHPKAHNDSINRNVTFYYVIDVNKIKMERDEYEPVASSYQRVFQDRNGNDSLGPTINYKSKYSPKNSEPLNLDEFTRLRRELNVPEELDFTIIFEELK